MLLRCGFTPLLSLPPPFYRSPPQDLEAFLTHIYRALAAATPLKDKVNVLTYFETLCVDTTAANVLINSSLTMLFVRMLRNSRAPLLRVRLASVLGLLVRHATFIAEELAATQVGGLVCLNLRVCVLSHVTLTQCNALVYICQMIGCMAS